MQRDERVPEPFIFCSLRYIPNVIEAVRKLCDALKARRPSIVCINVDVENAESISQEVSKQLGRSQLVLVFGSKTYGEQTKTLGCTYDEWRIIHNRQKPRFLIKMTKEFDFEYTRDFIFDEDKISFTWLPDRTGNWGEPPVELVDAIERKWHKCLRRRTEPLFTRQIDWEQVKVDEAFVATHGHSRLGQGGFGKVFKAVMCSKTNGDPDGRRVEVPVAVKVTWQASQRPRSGPGPRNRQQSVEEAMGEAFGKAVQEGEMSAAAEYAMVDRDLVVHVYGEAKGRLGDELARAFAIGADDECVGIILRYEGGGSLAERIDAAKVHASDPGYRSLPMGERLYILAEISRALHEIHDNAGMAHGDLKPENVFLSGTHPPMVRLGDFGTAENLGRGEGTGSTLVAASAMEQMTCIYAAPELLRFLLDMVAVFGSRRSDMYSFAIVMWEVLTLQTPFQAFNITQPLRLAEAVADESNARYPLRPSLDALPGDAPEGIACLITQCWSPERRNRPLAGECSQRLKVILDTARAAEVQSPVPTPTPAPAHVPAPTPAPAPESAPLDAMRVQLATLQARLDQAEIEAAAKLQNAQLLARALLGDAQRFQIDSILSMNATDTRLGPADMAHQVFLVQEGTTMGGAWISNDTYVEGKPFLMPDPESSGVATWVVAALGNHRHNLKMVAVTISTFNGAAYACASGAKWYTGESPCSDLNALTVDVVREAWARGTSVEVGRHRYAIMGLAGRILGGEVVFTDRILRAVADTLHEDPNTSNV